MSKASTGSQQQHVVLAGESQAMISQKACQDFNKSNAQPAKVKKLVSTIQGPSMQTLLAGVVPATCAYRTDVDTSRSA
ncbi:hypothetical protein LOC71_07330 [Rhodopirellula sp. JC740]|uniref:Uncharacterized protein n=1 Tax=Rhodopirellula halodulae TaxID=2894198 RepID=A0ABS8NGK9_9BACT|nr:hypothetical protein [Rhodopirellula sp. JC740]MCC9642082.1 hypothetical protein [Rhodopirellula sp. JC740]